FAEFLFTEIADAKLPITRGEPRGTVARGKDGRQGRRGEPRGTVARGKDGCQGRRGEPRGTVENIFVIF
ncbi:MAG: hypothetical protein LIO91_08185, partial [Bacteroidales bacterium]|nr:hypothetical protein [Bacteroidales bacterium]